MAFLVLGSLSQVMWLPAEVVSTPEGPYVGYVLQSDSRTTTLKLAYDSGVQRIATEDIVDRTVCEVDATHDRMLLDLLLRIVPEKIPTCSSLIEKAGS